MAVRSKSELGQSPATDLARVEGDREVDPHQDDLRHNSTRRPSAVKGFKTKYSEPSLCMRHDLCLCTRTSFGRTKFFPWRWIPFVLSTGHTYSTSSSIGASLKSGTTACHLGMSSCVTDLGIWTARSECKFGTEARGFGTAGVGFAPTKQRPQGRRITHHTQALARTKENIGTH